MSSKKRKSINKNQIVFLVLVTAIASFLIGNNYEALSKKFSPQLKETRAIEQSNKKLLETGDFKELEKSDNWFTESSECQGVPVSSYRTNFFTFSYPSDFAIESKYEVEDQAGVTLTKKTVWKNPNQTETTEKSLSISATKTLSNLLDEVKSSLHDTNLDISQYVRRTSLDGMEDAIIINNPGMYTSHTTVALENGVLYKIHDFGPDQTECGVNIVNKTFKRT